MNNFSQNWHRLHPDRLRRGAWGANIGTKNVNPANKDVTHPIEF
jgi:hypothetical protein